MKKLFRTRLVQLRCWFFKTLQSILQNLEFFVYKKYLKSFFQNLVFEKGTKTAHDNLFILLFAMKRTECRRMTPAVERITIWFTIFHLPF